MTVMIGTMGIPDSEILTIIPEPRRPGGYRVRMRSGACFGVYGCDLDADITRLQYRLDYGVMRPEVRR